jgi:hypothetical protein
MTAFVVDFAPDFEASLPLSGWPASCGGAVAFMEDIAEHVVGDIGHADLHRGPFDTNGSNEELHLVLLPGEDMLDGGSDL